MGNKASNMSSSALSSMVTDKCETSKSVTFSMKHLTVLTYNVWFDSLAFNMRMNYIIDKTLELNPDVCCFQEVLSVFATLLQGNVALNKRYVMSPFTASGYGTMTLVRRELSPRFETVEFPTTMGRSLLKTVCMVNGAKIGIGNVHLESLSSEKVRKKQLLICQRALKKYNTSILVGDFNFCSERNFQIIPNHPLENNVLEEVLPAYVDVWPFLRGVGFSMESSTEKEGDSELGFTFDSEINKMIPMRERMRYDRVLVRSGGSGGVGECMPAGIELVGVHAIPLPQEQQQGGQGQEQTQEQQGRPQVWPSDHFGLFVTFTTPEGVGSMEPELALEQVIAVRDATDFEDAPPIPPQSDLPPTEQHTRPRPVITVGDIQLKQETLSTGKDTVITRRDGTRQVERINKETGEVTLVVLDSVAEMCAQCGSSLGFQLTVSCI
jgi:endonuclease/exonuclease/phosphatase family metal-dependent hydrolase